MAGAQHMAPLTEVREVGLQKCEEWGCWSPEAAGTGSGAAAVRTFANPSDLTISSFGSGF